MRPLVFEIEFWNTHVYRKTRIDTHGRGRLKYKGHSPLYRRPTHWWGRSCREAQDKNSKTEGKQKTQGEDDEIVEVAVERCPRSMVDLLKSRLLYERTDQKANPPKTNPVYDAPSGLGGGSMIDPAYKQRWLKQDCFKIEVLYDRPCL